MTERTGVPEAVRNRLSTWAAEKGCRLLVLFGSAARDDGLPTRDLDLAVSVDTSPELLPRLALLGELQDVVGDARVDLVHLREEMDPVLRYEVFRGGVLLHEAESGLFVRETVRALIHYEDALPFRRALVRSLQREVQSA